MAMEDNKGDKNLRLALPNGSLQKETFEIFAKAGYKIQGYELGSRNYHPSIKDGDIELKTLRPQEIPSYVARGFYDIGITGLDWLLETGVEFEVEAVLNLEYMPVQMVLAIPKSWSAINSFEELLRMPQTEIRIATEYLNFSSKYILAKTGAEPSIITPWGAIRKYHNSNITLIFSWGSTEAKPPEEADAIIDIASPAARTISTNDLKIIDTILSISTAWLIANKKSLRDSWKMKKIVEIKDSLVYAMKLSEKDRILGNKALYSCGIKVEPIRTERTDRKET